MRCNVRAGLLNAHTLAYWPAQSHGLWRKRSRIWLQICPNYANIADDRYALQCVQIALQTSIISR